MNARECVCVCVCVGKCVGVCLSVWKCKRSMREYV